MKPQIIDINLDEKCKECGEKGIVENGLCLKCVSKRVVGQSKVQLEIKRQIDVLIDSYWASIHKAFLATEGGMSISLNVSLDGADPVKCKTTIAFVESKIKDSIESEVYSRQEKLPLKEAS